MVTNAPVALLICMLRLVRADNPQGIGILLAVAALLLALQPSTSLAQSARFDTLPKFDLASICRIEAAGDTAEMAACLQDEQEAATRLEKEWQSFPVTDRATCLRTEDQVITMRSYVELVSCLEMTRDARKLEK